MNFRKSLKLYESDDLEETLTSLAKKLTNDLS